ncbi:hypothetical protein M8542_38385 [Amycolatopsis sp. OK19-0408]|uniref:Uncharacterized protein n=1 Tax=Amycolatopsis iheyensis TaxID=2945988 RepID=A0A9X2NH99_9PSEU|nr:hypothetical protein [Amycolatopsis iheyensis]MCR6488714.1 hypothetical protein [Amycolatopsis iheyensis]
MPALTFPLKFERRFDVWSYAISHSVLLLRSGRTSAAPTRIDLMFRVVQEMRLRQWMDDVEIQLLTEGVSDRFADVQISGDRALFVILSAGSVCGFVVAGALYMSEDDLEYGERSTIDTSELKDSVIRSGYYLLG